MELCKVGLILNELPKKHYNALTLALKDHFIVSSYNIEASLREAGFNVSERTIDRHRTSRCKCARLKEKVMDEKSNLELIEIRTPVVYKHVVINNNVVKTNEVLKEAQIIKIKGETNE